ncbi:MAG TPA: hypothetical protein DCW90_09135 [Lachnospiraceae bacterium]|nr:hypothetical protein [Lachnospiraceae bacterium]
MTEMDKYQKIMARVIKRKDLEAELYDAELEFFSSDHENDVDGLIVLRGYREDRIKNFEIIIKLLKRVEKLKIFKFLKTDAKNQISYFETNIKVLNNDFLRIDNEINRLKSMKKVPKIISICS